MKANELAFIAMLEAAMNHGMPVIHKNDLVLHDRNTLGIVRDDETLPTYAIPDGTPFVWILRECGTELVQAFHVIDKERYEYEKVIDYFIGDTAPGHKKDVPNIAFLWNGKTLESFGTDRKALMDRVYEVRRELSGTLETANV